MAWNEPGNKDPWGRNKNTSNFEVFNLGTGKGSSVLEAIQSFERISGRKLNYKMKDVKTIQL